MTSIVRMNFRTVVDVVNVFVTVPSADGLWRGNEVWGPCQFDGCMCALHQE